MSNMILSAPKVFQKSPSLNIPQNLERNFGIGLSYPAECLSSSRWKLSQGEDKIKSSILNILMTPVGTRFMQPDYGSMLIYLVFNPINTQYFTEISFYTKEALSRWEPRVNVLKVEVQNTEIDSNISTINIYYVIKGTNLSTSIFIPFTLDNGIKFVSSNEFTTGGYKVFK